MNVSALISPMPRNCRMAVQSERRSDAKIVAGIHESMPNDSQPASPQRAPLADTTFERHYTISDLAAQWRLGRETVRLLVREEPGVLKIRLGRCKAMTRYSIPESVARRVHTKLFHHAA